MFCDMRRRNKKANTQHHHGRCKRGGRLPASRKYATVQHPELSRGLRSGGFRRVWRLFCDMRRRDKKANTQHHHGCCTRGCRLPGSRRGARVQYAELHSGLQSGGFRRVWRMFCDMRRRNKKANTQHHHGRCKRGGRLPASRKYATVQHPELSRGLRRGGFRRVGRLFCDMRRRNTKAKTQHHHGCCTRG